MVANGIKNLDLLPYHSFAENKYKKLGRKFETAGVKEHTSEIIAKHKAFLESFGLKVNVGAQDIEPESNHFSQNFSK
jgi:hypothetical protein